MDIPSNLMRARCKWCGRGLRYANLPNRGPVMVHAAGEGAACRRLIDMGMDIPIRQAKAERLANLKTQLAEQDRVMRKHLEGK
jgi:hypothetical protein